MYVNILENRCAAVVKPRDHDAVTCADTPEWLPCKRFGPTPFSYW
jgi:hypothetical protein